MIEDYANQTITWKRRTGQNAYNEPTFAPDASIKVRWEDKRRLVRSFTGEEVISEATIYTESLVEPNDVLIDPDGREWTVITKGKSPDLDGGDLFRKVMV